jgi:transcriptional regulator with XRE-family HTH domain
VEKDELKAFGLAVRQHRVRLNLSQDALADLAGLHRTYIGGIERGERNIGLLNVLALAKTLGVTASELLRTTESILKRE